MLASTDVKGELINGAWGSWKRWWDRVSISWCDSCVTDRKVGLIVVYISRLSSRRDPDINSLAHSIVRVVKIPPYNSAQYRMSRGARIEPALALREGGSAVRIRLGSAVEWDSELLFEVVSP
jgi:hypothetical protein